MYTIVQKCLPVLNRCVYKCLLNQKYKLTPHIRSVSNQKKAIDYTKMAQKPLILVHEEETEQLVPNKHVYENDFELITFQSVMAGNGKPEDIKGVLMNFAFGKDPQFQELLRKMTSLKVVTSLGVGTDSFENLMDYFREKSIVVALNTGEKYMCKAVADYAIGLFLSCCRRINVAAEFGKSAKAAMESEVFAFKYTLPPVTSHFTGATIGVIGLGRIGMDIAKRAHCGFDMKVLYYGRNRKSEEVEKQYNARYYDNLLEMLPLCDFVAVSCASTPETKSLIGEKEFNAMKRTAVLVNIARGAIVDTEAMTKALQEKKIAGVGLDVTEPEPLPVDHPLKSMDNVILTPHTAWTIKEIPMEFRESYFENFRDVIIHGRKPRAVKE